MRISRLVACGAATIVTAFAMSAASTAHADPINPSEGFVFPVVCDNGVTYQAVANGNGDFTPAHDLNSNTILVPTEFGPFHGVITDIDGNVLDEFTDPAMAKGSSTHDRATSTSCTYTIDFTGFDPDSGQVVHFSGSGTVEGFVTPVR